MAELLDTINAHIEALSLALVTMDPQDEAAIAQMRDDLQEIREDGGAIFSGAFSEVVDGLAGFLDKMTQGETTDLDTLEQGVVLLQRLFQAEINQTGQEIETAPVVARLRGETVAEDPAPDEPEETAPDDAEPEAEPEVAVDAPQEEPDSECVEIERDQNEPGGAEQEYDAPATVGEDDQEIFSGFVSESLESLETVEVQLIDLEQDDADEETINAIFRAFHTIKGVSSFLGMMRINCLAHRAENLLDKIRDNEIAVDSQVTDVILDSVDMLKRLIQGCQTGMETGGPLDLGLDISSLLDRIEDSLAGRKPKPKPVGQIMVEQGALKPEFLDKALEIQGKTPGKKLGQILIEEGMAEAKQVSAALRTQGKGTARKMDLQVKVDTQKLDSLVDLTGELVIAQSMLRQHPDILGARDQRLIHTMGQLNQITSSLQTITMALRMVPIKATFQKMLRLVRDLAKNSGKEVRLDMQGEDTEIDRNVVDELYEPMVHMIRNSVDHGLETPAEREEAGKESTGVITLRAYHKGGKIMVEISDDGRGLNRERILAKAVEKGLVDDPDALSDTEVFNLIFQPGFSTAAEVTEISGRGVGMDVVKRSLEKLRGRVDIRSVPGEGSTIIISLPLTLAIIEGMLVRVGQERYVIPALSIVESFRPTKKQCSTVENKGELILSRGKLIPLVRLETIFRVDADSQDPWDGLVVSVEYDGHRMGLLLDELLGKEEVVIKSMGEALKQVRGIAGGAILGDGRVGLILDMAGIWELSRS